MVKLHIYIVKSRGENKLLKQFSGVCCGEGFNAGGSQVLDSGQRIDHGKTQIVIDQDIIEIEIVFPGHHQYGESDKYRVKGVAADAAVNMFSDHHGYKSSSDDQPPGRCCRQHHGK